MSLKGAVDNYLINNFDRLQEERTKNGFSWKPTVEQISKISGLSLNPESETHRDYIRNRFLALRKIENIQTTSIKVEELKIDSKLIKAEKAEKTEYTYLDTYSKPQQEPKTEEEEFKLWKQEKTKLQQQVGMHVVIGCVHLPAVNVKFFNAFLKFLADVKPILKGFHAIGDILDCKSLSSHDKGQVSDTTLEKEYEQSNYYLDQLDEVLPSDIEKNYIWGNHEERYTRLLKQVDTAKYGKALLSPTAGCRFIERGYTVQEDYSNAKIQLGKYLDLIHGQYISTNSCKKHLDVYKKSIMFAHTHKLGTHFDTDKAAFNIGWMGDPDNKAFNYCSRVTREGWQNGFAIVNIDAEGYYHVQTIQYFNDRFFYGGKEYKG